MEARPVELLRALAVLAEPPGPEHARVAEVLQLTGDVDNASYSDVFLFQLYPYASVYVGEEGMMGGEAADRIGGFWSALGRMPPKEPDHLAGLLALYADLIDESTTEDPAEQALRREASRALFFEHLSPWIFGYLGRMKELVGGFYRGWATLLLEVLASEQVVSVPELELPVHLSVTRELSDPRQGNATDFLGALLAPVRSGIILTRADLGRLARELDLGLRAGERRYALQHLVSAEPAECFKWIAAEARRQARLHGQSPAPARVSAELARRALATADLCETLAIDSDGSATEELAGRSVLGASR